MGVLNYFYSCPGGGEFAHQKNCPGGLSGLELTDTLGKTPAVPSGNDLPLLCIMQVSI